MFHSIQGEGAFMGYTSVFIRLQGCPIGCEWCDAKLTWYAGGEKMTITQILERIDSFPKSMLFIITGGEPLIHNLDRLIIALRDHYPSRRIHLETSGARRIKGAHLPDWITLSPKHAAQWRVESSVFKALEETDGEYKFVVDDTFVEQLTAGHWDLLYLLEKAKTSYRPIYLMPEGAPPNPKSVAQTLRLLETNHYWRFSARLQYDYQQIADREGDTNQKISKELARAMASEYTSRRLVKQMLDPEG